MTGDPNWMGRAYLGDSVTQRSWPTQEELQTQ